MKKKKFLSILLLILISLIIIIFIIKVITSVNIQKLIDKEIEKFNENEQVFITIKDFFIKSEFDYDISISKDNIFEFVLSHEEITCFNYIFNDLGYTRITYYFEFVEQNNIIMFTYNPKRLNQVVIEIFYTGSSVDFYRGSYNINFENGWHFCYTAFT
ncbi:MAG: hypothetical protein FWG70_09690 [Oscillospiraceae bacterium]|nr:hypothetical protein [Oscillospiraceae bacterium]